MIFISFSNVLCGYFYVFAQVGGGFRSLNIDKIRDTALFMLQATG